MSATQSSISVSRMSDHPMSSSASFHSASLNSTPFRRLAVSDHRSRAELATFVDLQCSPYAPQGGIPQAAELPEQAMAQNPVPDLIPDEVYQLLHSNDLINEKGVRDYIIRRAFKAMREQQELKSSEALERLQTVYPYLQLDTIRKIIYRIGPGGNRKMF
ncbi:MAG TPA: hypothetical protein VFD13_06380 [Candidatus Kapabacteria bacterium]|nr:hypothetical protein [Candidatus Kapabacteria bacterium]